MNIPLGIESSNGSLGHGLSLGIGIALAAKKKNKKYKVYVFVGNGECNEGSVWEAIMSASSLKLDNLTAIVDNNGFQNEMEPSETILDTSDFGDKWESFGWNVCSVDGHNISELYNAFVELLKRFHEDWTNGSIDKTKVFIVKYDRIMTDFDELMNEILTFTGIMPTDEMMIEIKNTADKQRKYTSAHKYNLEKFGLNEDQIRSDCSFIYDTFLNSVINEVD
jgi:deoxyxylulose-5-phosphate synthase